MASESSENIAGILLGAVAAYACESRLYSIVNGWLGRERYVLKQSFSEGQALPSYIYNLASLCGWVGVLNSWFSCNGMKNACLKKGDVGIAGADAKLRM